MEVALSIGLMALLIVGNGYFSMSEMALVSSRRSRLETKAEEGSKGARKVIDLQEDQDAFLSTIQVAITLLGFGASAASTKTFADPLEKALVSLPIAGMSTVAPVLSVVIITLVVSYFTLVFGELVPKRIALSNPEKVASAVAGVIEFVQRLTKPLVIFLSASTGLVARVLHIKADEERSQVSEDEIRYIVSEQDDLLDEEKRMIHEIFNAGDTISREIMVPRVDMTVLEDTATLAQALEVMRETGFSRVPVYHEDIDRIVGVAHIKDILGPALEGKTEASIAEYMRDAAFVPDTKDILPLLSEMQTGHQQMVVVVDEYGGTAGIITVEDIVEEIVGEIADEFDPDNKYLTQLTDYDWLIDGRYPISDAIELGFPIEDTGEYETLAGWLLDVNDSFPRVGEVIKIENYSFKIQSMRHRRIALVRVTSPEPIDRSQDKTSARVEAEEDQSPVLTPAARVGAGATNQSVEK